jgi:hypothetical protein
MVLYRTGYFMSAFRSIFALLCFLGTFALAELQAFTLLERLKAAEKGDFFVTEQNRNLSLLLLRHIDPSIAIVEEICAPSSSLPADHNWQQWLSSGASGHTSWVMYEIDLNDGCFIEAFSLTKRGWLSLDDESNFLGKLLRINLRKVVDADRKKIGPPPMQGEEDRRKIWAPSTTLMGKKQKLACSAYKGQWENDQSILSGCQLHIYLVEDRRLMPFPIWVEVSNGHINFAMKTISCGKNLISPISHGIPKRPPKLLSIEHRNDLVEFRVLSPRYFQEFQLFAFSVTTPQQMIGPIPCSKETLDSKGLFLLKVKDNDINLCMNQGSFYKWVITPANNSLLKVESEEIFQWPNIARK